MEAPVAWVKPRRVGVFVEVVMCEEVLRKQVPWQGWRF